VTWNIYALALSSDALSIQTYCIDLLVLKFGTQVPLLWSNLAIAPVSLRGKAKLLPVATKPPVIWILFFLLAVFPPACSSQLHLSGHASHVLTLGLALAVPYT